MVIGSLGTRLVGRGGLGAAEDRAHAGDHLGAAERLDHVVVGAELEADDAVGLRAAGGEDDDRDARAGADRAADVAAVAVGQVEVEQDQVRLELLLAAASARAAVAATCGSKPSRSSALEKGAEIDCSSSTNRMRGRSDRHGRNVEGTQRLSPGLTRRWRALGGSWPIVSAMKPSRHQIAAGVTVRRPRPPRHRRPRVGRLRALGAAEPLPSRPPPPPRCGPRSSARPSAGRRARAPPRAPRSSPSARLLRRRARPSALARSRPPTTTADAAVDDDDDGATPTATAAAGATTPRTTDRRGLRRPRRRHDGPRRR